MGGWAIGGTPSELRHSFSTFQTPRSYLWGRSLNCTFLVTPVYPVGGRATGGGGEGNRGRATGGEGAIGGRATRGVGVRAIGGRATGGEGQ